MPYKFNPLTSNLELVTSPISVSFKKNYTLVDNAFLLPRTVTLDSEPLLDSELVFFNGLIIDDSCYTILINELTFNGLLNIKIGDTIDIRYAI
jgi:hypothetical protein